MPPKTPDPAVLKLADLLLEVAGKGISGYARAKQHVRILDDAMPHLSQAQAKIAQARIAHLETKWGQLLPGHGEINCNGAENSEIAPEKRIAAWLLRRNSPERLMKVIGKAAKAIHEGEKNLSDIMEKAYENETDRVLSPVGYDSFRQWLIELRIGVPMKVGWYVEWDKSELTDMLVPWGKQVEPSQSPFGEACLAALQQMKAARRKNRAAKN